MIPRISSVEVLEDYCLFVVFDDGKKVIYDVKTDMEEIPSYGVLQNVSGLFKLVKLDESRTCLFWNDDVDLPSDTIYEYGVAV